MSYTKNALHSPYKRIKGTPNTRQYRKTEVLRKKEEKCSQRQTTWPETRSKHSLTIPYQILYPETQL